MVEELYRIRPQPTKKQKKIKKHWGRGAHLLVLRRHRAHVAIRAEGGDQKAGGERERRGGGGVVVAQGGGVRDPWER